MQQNNYKNISLLAVLAIPILFQVCCYGGYKKDISYSPEVIPYKSAVHIKVKTNFKVCFQNNEACFDKSVYSYGSGEVVKNTKNGSIILTANHVCNIELPLLPPQITLKNIKFEYIIYDFDGNYFEDTKILKVDTFKDACLMNVDGLNMPALVVAKNAPQIGEKVYNVGFPHGIYLPGGYPIFEGFYSGQVKLKNSIKGEVAAYSIYVAGGSSGSMIINSYGELIGMVHSGFSSVDHFLFSLPFDFLRDFLKGI